MNTLLNYNNVWTEMHNTLLPHVTFYDYSNSEVAVYSTSNVGVVKEGYCYEISGFMLPNCEKFSISFILATGDIALRINPRLPQNYVVRNSRINNRWGVDEDASAYPFNLQRGTEFVIEVLVTDQRYMIAMNGHHFAKYTHRISFELLERITVHGDVNNVSIVYSEVKEYPCRGLYFTRIRIRQTKKMSSTLRPVFSRYSMSRISLTNCIELPFYGVLRPKTFNEFQHLRIEGRIKLLPWSFFINLQVGRNVWPQPIVAFHFRCRFARRREFIGNNMVTRTAWFDGRWASDNVSELTTDLRPAKTFSIVITRGLNAYEVYVDKNFIVDFQYLVDPDLVDTVFILGDVQLYDVLLENHDPEIYNKPRMSIDLVDILDNLL